MGEVPVNTRLLFVTLVALIAAPVLAGCAENGDTKTTTPTQTTGTTPTSTPTSTSPAPVKNLDLKIGTMMPLTGELNSIGTQMQHSSHLAISDVNAATATTGLKITNVGDEDDKTGDSAAAPDAYERLKAKGAVAIAGPCCSGVTRALLPKAMQDEIIIASPSATAPDLTDDAARAEFFWRVSPTDAGQGRVLADMVLGDQVTKAAMIIVNNDYGNGFATIFQQSFESRGGDVTVISKYPEVGATTFDSQVDEAAATNPQAIVLVAYADAGAGIMKAAYTKGLLTNFKWYASEGLHGPGFIEKAGQTSEGKSIVAGVKGTFPHVADLTAFNTAYKAKYPTETPDQYSPESYDAVIYLALAALKAGSTDGADIAGALVGIANPPGTACTSYVTCATLILTGQDVDYQGVAHDLEFDEARHEPTSGAYDLWRITDAGEFETYEETVTPEE